MKAATMFGLIVGNRGFFPAHLCESGRKGTLTSLEKAGIKVITLPTDATTRGAEATDGQKKT